MTARVREAEIVVRVLRGVLADRGAAGVVLAAPPGPERELLAGWLAAGGIEVSVPEPERAAAVEAALEARDRDPKLAREEAHRAVARVTARSRGLLVAGCWNRTALLLAGADLPPDPVLPLGDLPAGRVLELVGACSLPRPFTSLASDPRALRAVEDFLHHREGRLPGPAPELPPGVAGPLLERLAAARWVVGSPRVIPRLGARTPGEDLAGR